MRLLLATLLLFLFAAEVFPQIYGTDQMSGRKLDRFVTQQMSVHKIPGVSVAVLRNGKIVLLKSYGLANVEHQVPVKPETLFQSGSIGKQFTAAGIMMLVQENKLSLDDKITKFFPDVQESWKEITVRHLLTHTSGLGDYPPEVDLRKDYTETEIFALFKKASLDFKPGTNWNYSNVGYVTLGIIIGKVTGKFYADYLQEKIFKPAGMTTTRLISEADIVPNRASGYRLVKGELKNQEWVSPSTNSTADGSLYLSILDLAKWDAALDTEQPLSKSSREMIWTPVSLLDGSTRNYGFGWHLANAHGHRLVFHGGAWQGFKSFIIRFLDTKTTFIFLANSWETRDLTLARGIAASFYPEFDLPNVTTIVDTEPQTTALIRRALLRLTTRSADEQIFTSEFRNLIAGEQGERLQASLNKFSLPIAIIHTNELVEKRLEGDVRVYRYLLTDIDRSAMCTAKVTKENKVTSITVQEL